MGLPGGIPHHASPKAVWAQLESGDGGAVRPPARGTRGSGGLELGGVTFEWGPRKAAANFQKHGVAFEDASSVFFDPLAMTYPDPDNSLDEHREVTLGYTVKKDMVFVSHCERGERIRIISARPAD